MKNKIVISASCKKSLLLGFLYMLLAGVIIGLIISFFGSRFSLRAVLINTAIAIIFSEIIYYSCWGLFTVYEILIDREKEEEMGEFRLFIRVGIGLMGVLTGTEIAMQLIKYILDINLMSSTKNHLYMLLFNSIIGVIISLLFFFFNRLKRSLEIKIREVEKLKNLNLQSKLAVIQAKVNPHFLFNTLNTMLNLVHTQPDKLEKMILNLSGIYRKVLELPEDKLYALSSELDIVNSYLNIEKIRMGERLKFNIKVENEALYSFQIPPLIVQTIVENAVIHGIASCREGGMIIIHVYNEKNKNSATKNNVVIKISDNGKGINFDSNKGVTGFGIYSVKERLKLVYGFTSCMNIYNSENGGTEVKLEIVVNEN